MPITSSLLDLPKTHMAAGLIPMDAPTRWLSLSKTQWQPCNNGHLKYKYYWICHHHGGTSVIHIGMQNSELPIRYAIRSENF